MMTIHWPEEIRFHLHLKATRPTMAIHLPTGMRTAMATHLALARVNLN